VYSLFVQGCANAARRVLGRLGGSWLSSVHSFIHLLADKVQDVQIDVKSQKVDVTTDLSQEGILEVLKKTGKEVKAA
jgi:copper chaperone CopZ